MCGIFGRITPKRPVDLTACRLAIQALSHRGPDGLGVAAGQFNDREARFLLNPPLDRIGQNFHPRSDFFLGHRRLSILDLGMEAFQPISNEDGTVWVVFNGEIYNHASLRRQLESAGHRFRTDHSDTEVLVHGYEQWGVDLVDWLRGMFGFAILDLRCRWLMLARDRFGEKPLYYTKDRNGVTFASELKSFHMMPEMDRTHCPEALNDYLHHGMVPAPRCIYRHIRKLRAAERLLVDLDNPEESEPETYWSFQYDPKPDKTMSQWQEAFDAELRESVRLRMISDVPLGVFLSGGLDSSMITRETSRLTPLPMNTFSIGFKEKSFDESAYANQVASHFNTSHHARHLSPEMLLELIPRVSAIFDEPFADSSAIPTLAVSQLAREHVTVALSGDGGDELLAGYQRYMQSHRLAKFLDRQPDTFVRLVYGSLARGWPETVRGKSLISRMIPGAKARYFQNFRDDYLVGQMLPELASAEPDMLEAAWSEDDRCLIDRMCAFDRRFYIPEDLMVKVDRTSMSVSLEARAPLLDHKLFELVGRMPLATRFNGKEGKLPFRRILRRELGRRFVDRKKKGFSIPIGSWFRNELREELTETLLQSNGLIRSLASRERIEGLINGHCRGQRDFGARLWKLYMLQKWHEQSTQQPAMLLGRRHHPRAA